MPRLVNGLEQIFTSLGIVGNGYKLFFFEYNTTTPKTTYSDQDLSIENPNPVECLSNGRPQFDIWGADPATYKLVLGTPDSVMGNINPVVTLDPVDSIESGSIINLDPLPAAYWGITSGTSTDYTLAALVPITSYSNKQCFFLDFHIACGASPTIDINEIGTVNLKKYTGQGTKVALQAGDVQTQRYIAINDVVDIVILNPEIVQNLKANNLTVNTTINGALFGAMVTVANNGSDTNNDIDFLAGSAFDTTSNIGWAVSALTKRLDATWAAGNNQGGLFSGSKASGTWYHCFAIYDPVNNLSDFGFDTSVIAANRPVAYTGFKRVWSIRTNGSSNILPFTQNGQTCLFTTPIVDINAAAQAADTETLRTLTTPLGVKTNAIMTLYAASSSGASGVKVYSPDITSVTLAATDGQVYASNAVVFGQGYVQAITNTSSQVKSNRNAGSGGITITITLMGYVDYQL